MKCADYRSDLSALVDDALELERARKVRDHLRDCGNCSSQVDQLTELKRMMRATRMTPPPDLALALRVHASRRARPDFFGRLRVRLENMMEPFAVPAMAGLVAAVMLFGVLIHTLAIPTPAQTGEDEISMALNTKPRLMRLPPLEFNADVPGLSVEIHVDEEGRIVDFRTLNGPADPDLLVQLRRVLLFTKFNPATSFGYPRHGTAVHNFQIIHVKG